jgi:uncharacterized protein YfaS (alpha-2-macroglobulin family)
MKNSTAGLIVFVFGLIPLFFLIILLTASFKSLGSYDNPFEKSFRETIDGDLKKFEDEQKYSEALSKATALKEEAEKKGDIANYTFYLIEEFKLKSALHAYETALKEFVKAKKPDHPLAKAILTLYEANALSNYLQGYLYEISKREKVSEKDEFDYDKYTKEELYQKIKEDYLSTFNEREKLENIPLNKVPDFINKGSYPEEILSNLRDYLTVSTSSLLASTYNWTPYESTTVYSIPIQTLLDRDTLSTNLENYLKDKETHPLLLLSSILSYEERESLRKGRKETALEFHLRRSEAIFNNISNKEDKRIVIDELIKTLKDFEDVKWYSTGMAQVADFEKSLGDEECNIRAKDFAEKGYKKFPASPGGQKCIAIINEIKQPDFNIENQSSDIGGMPSIRVSHKNLTKIYLKLIPVDVKALIYKFNELPRWNELFKIVKETKIEKEFEINLEDTPDYNFHHTYFKLPTDLKKGSYVCVATYKNSFSEKGNKIVGTLLTITEIAIIPEKNKKGKEVTYTFVSGSNSKPISDVDVSLISTEWGKPPQLSLSGKSDKDGILKVNFSSLTTNYYLYLFANKGEDRTFIQIDRPYDYSQVKNEDCLIFTDRSIYRVGQKILFKIIAFSNSQLEGPFKLLSNSSIEVNLTDLNYENVGKLTLTTNKFGSASGEFTIPEGRPLGVWRIQTSFGSLASIRVEEYKRPTFEVEIKEPSGEMKLNKEVTINAEAKYYFGMPLNSGKVRYTVERRPRFPWWFCYFYGTIKPEIIASGEKVLNNDGTFEIKFTPKADERLKQEKSIYYTYKLSVTVTDEGGETRSDEKSFNIGFISMLPSISPKKNFFTPDEKCQFELKLTDLNGKEEKGSATYKIYSLKLHDKTTTPEDFKYQKKDSKYAKEGDKIIPRWETPPNYKTILSQLAEDKEIKSGNVNFDEKGKANLEVSNLPSGVYKIKIEVSDKDGEVSKDLNNFIVASSSDKLNLPQILISDKDEYEVGEKAKILVYCGYDGNRNSIKVFSKKGLFLEKDFSTDRVTFIDIPIDEELRGGISFQSSFVKDYCLFRSLVSANVPYSNRVLKISYEKFREKITPNVKEVWKVKIDDPQGKPVSKESVELLASMYDKSLDLFTPHNFPSFSNFFPRSFTPPFLNTSLGIGQHLFFYEESFRNYTGYPTFEDPHLMQFSGYGIGGPGRRSYAPFARQSLGLKGEVEEAVPSPAAAPLQKSEMKDKAAPLETANSSLEEGVSGGAPPEKETTPKVEMRENFQETAFFYPHLLTESDGTVSIEFVPPDSLTEYKLMLFAHEQGISSAFSKKECKSSKDFMIRPYLPRFLREGDELTLKVMANNSTKEDQKAKVYFKILDAETEKEITNQFLLDESQKVISIKGNQSETTYFKLKVPKKIGLIKIEVAGISNQFTDGERRIIPILPSRVHLFESKFVTLKENEKREILLDDLLNQKDKTRENELLVVTLDAQLLYSVIEAMPYIVDYPYECNEQLVNKFATVSILDKIIEDNPPLQKLFLEFSKRETLYESFYNNDPNRRMALEETPFLVEAKGGKTEYPILQVLNPDVCSKVKESSLKKLLASQDSSGGWAWFSGGRPSSYITLYILYTFSKAKEFGVEIPDEPIKRAFQFLKNNGLNEDIEWLISHDCGWEFITFLNYTLSNFKDDSYFKESFSDSFRKKMVDFSFKHWKEHSPYLKLQLALTLKRMNREKDCNLVHESVFDSAITKQDEGTFFMIEDKTWLWYNDTVETQAFALKELMEINPKDEKGEGLLLWLFLNKKLNHWKSTKATAEALYSILSYLKSKGAIAVKESIKVDVGKNFTKTFVYEPGSYTGKRNQLVFEKEDIKGDMGKIDVAKEGKGFAFASATLHFSTEELPSKAKGDFFEIERSFYKRVHKGKEFVLEPINDATILNIGDQIEVELKIKSKNEAEYIHILAPRPSGCEPEKLISGWLSSTGIYFYEMVRDSKEDFFIENIPKGEFKLRYRLRVANEGVFKVAPATMESMYAPEFKAYSSGKVLTISPK